MRGLAERIGNGPARSRLITRQVSRSDAQANDARPVAFGLISRTRLLPRLYTRSQIQSPAVPASDSSPSSAPETPMPNITINAARLQSSVVFRTSQFKPGDCANYEGCVSGPG